MTTSRYHEIVKTIVARLLEMWAVELDVSLTGYGAATFRKRAKERGLEPGAAAASVLDEVEKLVRGIRRGKRERTVAAGDVAARRRAGEAVSPGPPPERLVIALRS